VIYFNQREVAFRELGNIGVAMRRGDLFEFEAIGVEIIKEIRAAPTTCLQVARRLAQRYQIPCDRAFSDVCAYVSQLSKCNLVEISEDTRREISSSETSEVGASTPDSIRELTCWALARARHIPFKCKFEVTYRCNIACKFCYNGERPGLPGPYPKHTELCLDEIERVLSELYDAGTFILTLTGGEPFARQDFSEILHQTDRLGFGVEILTNGTLITRDVAKKLSGNRIQMVVIPLFGSTSSTHDSFVKMPGSFRRACNAIEWLLAEGVEVGVRCAITQENFKEWRAQRELVAQLGARYFPHLQVHLSSDRAVDLRSIRLPDDDAVELFEGGLELNPGYRCEVGMARVDVLPNGDVALCSLLTAPLGNLRGQSFAEIWHGSPELRDLRAKLQGPVRNCSGCHQRGDEAYRCTADALFDDGGLDRTSSEALRVINLAGRYAGTRSSAVSVL